MKPLKIGKIALTCPLFLAPMVDVTDIAYRQICRQAGAEIAYTEMIVVDALLHDNERTKSMMKTSSEDKPIGIQITGDDLEKFKKAIPLLKKFDLVDLNCGCPSSRIQDNKAGSFLLKDPEKIASIIRLLKSAGLTVTAKIRLGYDKNEVLHIAKIIEDAGADAITIHARLAIHGNDTPADWKWIAAVKGQSKIPIIGNGDVTKPEDAKEMLKFCDGVMIARAAIGNPSIFKQTKEYLKSNKYTQWDFKDNLNYFIDYLQLVKKYNIIDIPRIKYIGGKFLRGTLGTAKLRDKLMHLKTYEEILVSTNELLSS
jgi:tRNA-dihydrouridine synthase B